MQDALWVAAVGAVLLALVAALAERRRARRHDLDSPGWVPWRGVQVAAFFAAAGLAMLASALG